MPDNSLPSSVLGTYAGAVADLIAQRGSTAYSYGQTGTKPDGYPSVGLAAGSQPSSYTDCSGWVSYALSSVAPVHAAVLAAARTEPIFNNRTVTVSDGSQLTLNEAADWSWARADVLSTKFATATGANGFTSVPSFAALTGGDIIAYSTGIYALLGDPDTTANPLALRTVDTGHTMIVTAPPVEVPEAVWNDGSGSQPPDIATVWAVPVVDSSNLPHFETGGGFTTPQDDVRDYNRNDIPSGAPDGSDPGGLGRGTMWFAQDAQGNITHFRFAQQDHWIPNTDVSDDNKALLIAAVRPTSAIDLGATDLVNGQLQVRTYPNAQDTIDDQTYSLAEQLTGQGGLAVSGGGTLHLSAGNTFTGDVSVSDSNTVLAINGDSALGGNANALTLGDGTVLQLTGAVALAHKLILGGNATITLGPGSSSSLSGEVAGSGTSLLVVKGGGTLALSGQLSGVDEVWASGAQTSIALDGSARTGTTVLRLDQGTGLTVSGSNTVAKLVAGTNETVTLSNQATLTVTGGIHQPSGATSLTQVTVAGDGKLIIQENGMTQITVMSGHTIWSGTLAQLDGAILSGFTAGDTIDVTDTNPVTAGVVAKYDNVSGALTITRGNASATLQLTAGITNTQQPDTVHPLPFNLEFTVRSDGSTGSIIDTATAAQDQSSVGTRAILARANSGLDGTHVTVGIISDSFNLLGGMAQDVANHHLTSNINILAESTAGGADEGREMARVVQNIAPGATIDFVSEGYTGDDFTRSMQVPGAVVSAEEQHMANAIYRLAEEHVNVIVDDIGLPDGSTYQEGGVLANAIAYARSQGITLLTSAGNEGGNYYENNFVLSQTDQLPQLGSTYAYAFNAGQGPSQFLQEITVTSNHLGETVPIKISWDQPAQGSSYNLNVAVFTLVNGSYVPVSTDRNNGGPYVTDPAPYGSNSSTRVVTINNIGQGGQYYLAVTGNMPASGLFKLFVNHEGATKVFNSAVTDPGSGNISGHALDPNEITVGAVNWQASPYSQARELTLPRQALVNENFSAFGPGQYLYDANGNRLANPILLGKPDISGVDGASDDTGGTTNAFFGTSAAAPSVAGVVALLLQANPSLTPAQVKAALQASALPMPNAAQAGAGLVQADAALALAVPPQIGSITAAPDTTTGPLGLGHVLTFTLRANTALSVIAAADGSLPTLTLDNGGVAIFDGTASSGSSLVFHTTVGTGQSSAALTVTSLALNGSALQNGATLQLTDGSLAAVQGAQTGLAVAMQPETTPVFRFFDSTTGTHFFTASADERTTILATRPDLVPEGQDGVGMQAVNPAAGDAYSAPVFRFFDTVHGTQFLTTSATERDTILAGRPDLTFEPTDSFYMHTQAQAGDTAVYRFFSSTDGTHFYTDSDTERASILQTRPDLVSEGIGFYEPGRAGT